LRLRTREKQHQGENKPGVFHFSFFKTFILVNN